MMDKTYEFQRQWEDMDPTQAHINKQHAEITRLRAEVERLQQALEHIHRYAAVAPVMHLTQEKRGVWEMAIEGAAMHVKRAARAALHHPRQEDQNSDGGT